MTRSEPPLFAPPFSGSLPPARPSLTVGAFLQACIVPVAVAATVLAFSVVHPVGRDPGVSPSGVLWDDPSRGRVINAAYSTERLPQGMTSLRIRLLGSQIELPVPQGELHLADGVYTVRDGYLWREGVLRGSVAAVQSGEGADEKDWLLFRYRNSVGKIFTGDLLSRRTPTLEGSQVLLGDVWWAFAKGWLRVGKPVIGHSYPGFELSGGGLLRDRIRQLIRHSRPMRRRGRRARRYRASPFSAEDLELLQRIADAETGGKAVCVSTYDNQLVSFGIRQWTLGSGRLQSFIRANAGSFARYGISVLDTDPQQYWTVAGSRVPPLAGVDRPEQLCSAYWTARFYRAGQDNAIFLASLRLAARELYHRGGGGSSHYLEALDVSACLRAYPRARAVVAELENNRPGYTSRVVQAAVDDTRGLGTITEPQFLGALMRRAAEPYEREYLGRWKRNPGGPGSPAGVRRAGHRFAVSWMARVLHKTQADIAEWMRIPLPPPPPVQLVTTSLPAVRVVRTSHPAGRALVRPAVLISHSAAASGSQRKGSASSSRKDVSVSPGVVEKPGVPGVRPSEAPTAPVISGAIGGGAGENARSVPQRGGG